MGVESYFVSKRLYTIREDGESIHEVIDDKEDLPDVPITKEIFDYVAKGIELMKGFHNQELQTEGARRVITKITIETVVIKEEVKP